MQPPKENPASLAASGAPNSDLADAPINSDFTIVSFRKQALRTTDAIDGQLAALNEHLFEYVHEYAEPDLRLFLAYVRAIEKIISADLDYIDAEEAGAGEAIDQSSNLRPEPGAGLLGLIGHLGASEGGAA